MKYCHVAVNSPFNDSLLSYVQEDKWNFTEGDLVKVPLGKRMIEGCLLKINLSFSQLDDSISEEKIKPIEDYLTEDLKLSQEEILFYQWIAGYYHYPVGKLIFDCLPKILKKPHKLLPVKGIGDITLPIMTPDQEAVWLKIKNEIDGSFKKFLLHGVTGSGKTIIYLNLIQEMLSQNKSVLFLLPEINLTPQFIHTFSEYLKVDIYPYNSSISNSKKYEMWRTLKNKNEPCVVIGVRSSIFLPINNLGLIIVDEEHDHSFKQEDRCPYNARDLAIKKASLLSIPVILGSATPSVETYYNFQTKDEKNYFSLKERVNQSKLPLIDLVDLRKDKSRENQEIWPFKEHSIKKITEALSKNEQVVVFVNRLGYANYLQCSACGYQFFCPNCTINLKYFHKKNEIQCQYCDYTDKKPEICPQCSNLNILQIGFGTEKLQQVLKKVFPSKTIGRFDRDDVTTFKKLEQRLDDFHRGKIDILVGTQMLSKGHNFKNVNLVLIFGVDLQLNFPDFRSNERAYQLLTQISGRSGRFGKDSEVLIHTLAPENRVYQYVKDHDFNLFYEDEIKLRKMSKSPPYSKIAIIYVTSQKQNEVIEEAEIMGEFLKNLGEKYFQDIVVLGPRTALIEKKVNKYTWVFMLRGENVNNLHNLLSTLQKQYVPTKRVGIKIDVDPYQIQ
ncbi:MAG: primosomal protein N' [Bdellovibrionales bacterium RIFOXYA1_FULL_36_14]|nr:MAG: primosomal protein N' [Bdellovibrionales bacterium RIFOXYA1_FULL_36_14]